VEIREFCARQLAGDKRPRHVLPVEKVPRNTVGKILKRELRKRVQATLEAVNTPVARS
jgi:acyl-CoA synthetase (AMP-forming)/AMP-acid ligase II